MIDVGFRLIEVLLTIEMHEIKLVDQAETFQQVQRPVDGRPIDPAVTIPRERQESSGIEVTFGFLHYFDEGFSLGGDANPPMPEILQQQMTFRSF